MIKIYPLLVLFFSSFLSVFAQVKTIKGIIYDQSSGDVLIGGTVSIKGTSKGVISNLEGRYEIRASIGDVLVFSYVGYKTEEIKILKGDEEEDVDVYMAIDALEEVRVVGYGKVKKKNLIGAQQKVKGEDLDIIGNNILQGLQGKVAGLNIERTSGGSFQQRDDISIRVRGGGFSFRSDDDLGNPDPPLVVIDGLISSADILESLDPENIKDITVLKDALSTSVYGIRGANGVLLVETKKGAFSRKPKISLSVNQSFTSLFNAPDLVDGPTYMRIFNEGLQTRGQSPVFTQEDIAKTISGEDPDLFPNVDWFDELFNDFGSSFNARLGVNGGSEKLSYNVSGQYFREKPTYITENIGVPADFFGSKRFNLTSSTVAKINRTLRINSNFTLGYTKTISTRNEGGLFNQIVSVSPVDSPVLFSNGQIPAAFQNVANEVLFGNDIGNSLNTTYNPYGVLNASGIFLSESIQARLALGLQQNLDFIIKGLRFNANLSYSLTSGSSIVRTPSFTAPYIQRGRDAEGNLITDQISSNAIDNFELARAAFNNDISSSNEFETMVENGAQTNELNFSGILQYDSFLDENNNHAINSTLVYNQLERRVPALSGATLAQLAPRRSREFIARTNISSWDKYTFQGSVTYSGSNQLPESNKYGLFYSLGAGWTVSEEKFFKPLTKVITNLRLSYGYGLVGSPPSGSQFRFVERFRPGALFYSFGVPGNEFNVGGIDQENVALDLIWTSTFEHNYALDLTLFGNFNTVISWFDRRIENDFIPNNLRPLTSGFNLVNNPGFNAGIAENYGLDVTLSYNKSFKNINFSVNGNIGVNQTKVIFDGRSPRFPYQDLTNKKTRSSFSADQLSLVALGLFESQEQIDNSPFQQAGLLPGDIRYKDLNGDGIITEDDLTFTELQEPEIPIGLGLSVRYKSFLLNTQFSGILRKQVDVSDLQPFGPAVFFDGNNRQLFNNISDRWTVENPDPNAFYPRLSDPTGIGNSNNFIRSSFWLKRADYISLKSVAVSYDFKLRAKHKIMTNKYFKKLTLTARATDLAVFSKFKLFNPELFGGFEFPITSTYALSISINF